MVPRLGWGQALSRPLESHEKQSRHSREGGSPELALYLIRGFPGIDNSLGSVLRLWRFAIVEYE